MNASAIKELLEGKIFSKLHEPLSECPLNEFPNITSSVNPEQSSNYHAITHIWEKNCERALIYTALQITN